MAQSQLEWMSDERRTRIALAMIASAIAVGALLTREDQVVTWSLLAPTVAVFWLTALYDRVPRWFAITLAISIPIVLNIIDIQDEVSMFLLVLAIAVMGSTEQNRELVKIVTVITMAVLVTLFLSGPLRDMGMLNWLFGVAFTWVFGEIVFRYSKTIDELEVTRALIADQAALQERRRIARDVHDLVGHSLSVVMLHLTGARHLVHKDPFEAERALEQAEAAGRESLAEIRRTVGLLRDDSDSQNVALPSPDLSDIALLVDEFLLAGLEIELRITGNLDVVEGASALAGYRIVQEALTNASRHNIGAEVLVSVDVAEAEYEVTVQNRGGTPTDVQRGSGFGLVSMLERAKSVGGSVIAGPTPSGWNVNATLPVIPIEVSR